MSSAEYSQKLDELDRLLNDPDVPMQPDRIWSLLADVSRPETTAVTAVGGSAMGEPADRLFRSRRLDKPSERNLT
ncbi:hypothetical protein [Rhodopila sp.]|uniref:hypothetical protein n=1 Tax=Rhodopila sp. TaxID=2480087 RepID=UPI003D133304